MRKLYVLAGFVCTVVITIVMAPLLHAAGPGIVISQVQFGNSLSAYYEFIEVYNNSDKDVEVTDWCLRYASASSVEIGNKLTCFVTDSADIHLFLPSFSSVFSISNQLSLYLPDLGSDAKFAGGLSGTAGHIRLMDKSGTEVDKLGWGVTAQSAEGGKPAMMPTTDKIIGRKATSLGILQDTDVNSDDFEIVPARTTYAYGQLYEVQDLCLNIDGIQDIVPDGLVADITGTCLTPIIDACSNIDEIQTVVPDGYLLDEAGNCQSDMCLNIDGLQIIIPDGMDQDDAGKCIVHDECLNLDGIQGTLPVGFVRSENNVCSFGLLPLQITEMLPNAAGSDEGNEFIEFYNPNDVSIDLLYFYFKVGEGLEKRYKFPIGSKINAGQYLIFSNNDIGFTLVNTTSRIQLSTVDDVVMSESPEYNNSGDGLSWALIDDVWQYTNRPTPGDANLVSLTEVAAPVENAVDTTSDLAPCAANQYRSLETNRCRLIVTTDSTLAPCKDGQYRSEETNRCRSIVSDVASLITCAEGQERNPDTNRCRSVTAEVLGASTLKPCDEGYERNPETNRCRKAVSTMPLAGYAPEKVNQSENNYVLWLSLGGVGLLAVGYGIFEWRQEILRIVKKITSFVSKRK